MPQHFFEVFRFGLIGIVFKGKHFIDRYIGKAIIVETNQAFLKNKGLAFREGKLRMSLLKKIKAARPLFIIIGNEAKLEIELERSLLKSKILTITGLVNMEKLPANKPFMFYGVPLKIKSGDGSPIRAFAVLG